MLRLVAEGRLTPEEAAPLVAALAEQSKEAPRAAGQTVHPDARPSRVRVLVRENGRSVVDLQIPSVLAELASAMPGIPRGYTDRVREALRQGLRGPIVDVRDEDGSGVSITID